MARGKEGLCAINSHGMGSGFLVTGFTFLPHSQSSQHLHLPQSAPKPRAVPGQLSLAARLIPVQPCCILHLLRVFLQLPDDHRVME